MTGLPLIIAFAVLVTCLAMSYGLTGLVLTWLRRQAILDHPNDRSSHTVPTPRGGGWGVVLTLLPMWLAIAGATGNLDRLAPVLAGAVALVAVSWIDDRQRRGVNAGLRLLVQALAVALGLWALPDEGLVFQGLLPWLPDRIAAWFCWLWFVNLFNFMDGIDGLAGTEAASIGAGLAVVALLAGTVPGLDSPILLWQSAAVLGAALGFLAWNWQPARVFMGDVGSVPLGFVLGWLLATLAAAGLWAAALLVPLYFLADATLTLLRRLAEGKKVWQAHREHFYQQAVQRGRSHATVVHWVIATNLLLIAAAGASVAVGWVAVPVGGVMVAVLLRRLASPAAPPAPERL